MQKAVHSGLPFVVQKMNIWRFIMADERTEKQKVQEITDKLEEGLKELFESEKYKTLLAEEIDQFSYDFDTYQYKDTVEDRDAQIQTITEDIRSGNVGYLNDFLNAVISEGVREGITDIFGQGTEIEDSEAIQEVRKARELLDKLAEYKPLAKVEELEEPNIAEYAGMSAIR